MRLLRISLILFVCTSASAFDVPKDQYAEFKPHMQAVYGSLIKVMGVLLKGSDSLSPKERETLEPQFKNLAEHAHAIQGIAGRSDKGHQVLAAELSKSTMKAYKQFKDGNTSQTRFFLSDVVNTCFSCHTSRSSTEDSRFVVDFNKDLKWNEFDPLSQARFLALSRQFEAASKQYEKLFLSNELSADELINFDPLIEYLVINIRVRGDAASVLKTLQSMKLDAYPELVKKDLTAWVSALKADQAQKPKGSSLSQAKNHMKKALVSMEYPRDRVGLIHYIFASKLLHEVVQSKEVPAPEKADAYYHLGIAELGIGSPLFADEPNAYFEEAIRLQPKTALARKAFAQFQENILFSYTGSSGTNLPDDEKAKIEQLKSLAY